MCLAVPGELLATEGEGLERVGQVCFGGIVKRISLACLPEAAIGDFVVVHAGFALTRLDEAEARRVFECLDEMESLAEKGP